MHTLSVDNVGYQFLVRDIYSLVNQEVATEREACAQIADKVQQELNGSLSHDIDGEYSRLRDGDDVHRIDSELKHELIAKVISKRIRNKK